MDRYKTKLSPVSLKQDKKTQPQQILNQFQCIALGMNESNQLPLRYNQIQALIKISKLVTILDSYIWIQKKELQSLAIQTCIKYNLIHIEVLVIRFVDYSIVKTRQKINSNIPKNSINQFVKKVQNIQKRQLRAFFDQYEITQSSSKYCENILSNKNSVNPGQAKYDQDLNYNKAKLLGRVIERVHLQALGTSFQCMLSMTSDFYGNQEQDSDEDRKLAISENFSTTQKEKLALKFASTNLLVGYISKKLRILYGEFILLQRLIKQQNLFEQEQIMNQQIQIKLEAAHCIGIFIQKKIGEYYWTLGKNYLEELYWQQKEKSLQNNQLEKFEQIFDTIQKFVRRLVFYSLKDHYISHQSESFEVIQQASNNVAEIVDSQSQQYTKNEQTERILHKNGDQHDKPAAIAPQLSEVGIQQSLQSPSGQIVQQFRLKLYSPKLHGVQHQSKLGQVITPNTEHKSGNVLKSIKVYLKTNQIRMQKPKHKNQQLEHTDSDRTSIEQTIQGPKEKPPKKKTLNVKNSCYIYFGYAIGVLLSIFLMKQILSIQYV